MLNLDVIRQATRLTRAGQLVEATVLLQSMLRGDSVPDAPSRREERLALDGREPLTIDANANAIQRTDKPDIVPDGTRFVATRRGAAPISSSSPAAIRSDRFH